MKRTKVVRALTERERKLIDVAFEVTVKIIKNPLDHLNWKMKDVYEECATLTPANHPKVVKK